MPTIDRHIDHLVHSIFIDAMDFTGLTNVAIDCSKTTTIDLGAGIASVATGAAITKEIATLGMNAVKMDTAGDELCHFMKVPWDIDPTRQIRFRVWYLTTSTDTANTNTWKVLVNDSAADAAITQASGALDTAIAADTDNGTANAPQVTSWGVLNADTLTRDEIDAGHWWTLAVELDAIHTGYASDDVFLLGLEIQYTPQMTTGAGMGRDANYSA